MAHPNGVGDAVEHVRVAIVAVETRLCVVDRLGRGRAFHTDVPSARFELQLALADRDLRSEAS